MTKKSIYRLICEIKFEPWNKQMERFPNGEDPYPKMWLTHISIISPSRLNLNVSRYKSDHTVINRDVTLISIQSWGVA